MNKQYLLISGAIFGVVAILHAIRLFTHWTVQVGSIAMPVVFSLLAMFVAGGLCVWAFTLLRK